jgi:hypothetical protein
MGRSMGLLKDIIFIAERDVCSTTDILVFVPQSAYRILWIHLCQRDAVRHKNCTPKYDHE